MSFQNSGEIIKEIDELNKEKEVNLIVLNLKDQQSLPVELENYLTNPTKNSLIAKEKILFKNIFIFRENFTGELLNLFQ